MNSDELFKTWEMSIDKLDKNMEKENIAEINYDSVFASALRRMKDNKESATLSEKLAKGEKDVLDAKLAFLECSRLVLSGRAKINFLEASIHSLRLKEKLVGKVL